MSFKIGDRYRIASVPFKVGGFSMMIDLKYLREHPTHIFVFGDNTLHRGYKGAAALRREPNTYAFITKKFPSSQNDAFYRPAEYEHVYEREMAKLIKAIEHNPDHTFLISRLGAGLANRHRIFERVIAPDIKLRLGGYPNVRFLW
jgi:hypothetical protein